MPEQTSMPPAAEDGRALDRPDARGLDRLVAKKVLGYRVAQTTNVKPTSSFTVLYALRDGDGNPVPGALPLAWWPSVERAWEDCPHFSTDIAQAWSMLERFEWPEYRVRLERISSENWWCQIEGGRPLATARASSAARAICLAALTALGVAVPDGE